MKECSEIEATMPSVVFCLLEKRVNKFGSLRHKHICAGVVDQLSTSPLQMLQPSAVQFAMGGPPGKLQAIDK